MTKEQMTDTPLTIAPMHVAALRAYLARIERGDPDAAGELAGYLAALLGDEGDESGESG